METYAKEYLTYAMRKHDLTSKGWTYKLNRNKNSAGLCDYNKKRIELSRMFILGKNTTAEEIKDTVLHEVAHSLTPGCGHNYQWRKKAIEIGCNGKRCCKEFLQEEDFKYRLVCENGCKIMRHRINKKQYHSMCCSRHKKKLEVIVQH